MDARLQMLRRRASAALSGDGELSLDADTIDHIRERGLAFLEHGHIARARAIFELLVFVQGEDPGLLLVLACCHEQVGERDAARDLVGRILAAEVTPDLRQAALGLLEEAS